MKFKLIKLKKNQATFPLEIFYDQDITSLEIISEQLEQIPPEIQKLHHLKTLSITAKNITSFPKEIQPLTSLEVLKIKNTMIKGMHLNSLPKTLKAFIFTNGQIQETPKCLYGLPHLEHLNLSGNQLTNFPHKITHWQKLKRLVLDGNQIQNVPVEIQQCSHLTHLSLDGNPLNAQTKEMLKKKFGIWF